MIPLNRTSSLVVFGSSIPITAFPGIGATILMLVARRARARSSERLTILLIFTPGAGSYSKVVMTGPGSTVTTFPLTPKSSSFFSSSFDCICKFSSSADEDFSLKSSRKLTEGSWNPLSTRINSKTSCFGTGASLIGLGLGDLIVTFFSGLPAFSFFILECFFDFSLCSFHLIINVRNRSAEKRIPSQQRFPDCMREKPVAMMKPITQKIISIMALPVTLEYFTRNDFKGIPMMPPDENLLPKRTKWFCLNASKLPVVIIRRIPPPMVNIIALPG